jgi:hypothetical protein
MKDFSEETENTGKYIFLKHLSSFISQMEFITVSYRIRAHSEARGRQMLRSNSHRCQINCKMG